MLRGRSEQHRGATLHNDELLYRSSDVSSRSLMVFIRVVQRTPHLKKSNYQHGRAMMISVFIAERFARRLEIRYYGCSELHCATAQRLPF